MANLFGMEFSGISMPSFSGIGGGIMTTIFILCIGVLICIIAAVGIWMWYQSKVFNKKIIIYENISGQGFQKTGIDTARLIKVGDGGEEILYLRKRKIFRTAYGKKMGKNEYWFAVGQDGYWYNIVLGDLDAKLGMLDIEPIDRDMRYMHVAIRKNIQDRYKKQNWMEKYGSMIMNFVFLLIMLVGIWFLISKMSTAMGVLNQALTINKDVLGSLSEVVSKLDTLCSGGSGYVAT